ncbi:radical SAM domain-containing protein [Listeria phage LP-032]|uniref:Radical SAM domain-containing protein n=4 Tax=Homburgvirus TaxID=1921125 RepID=A0A059TAP0_9CAUD|nr:radical SAM domain-containing protein [Listeria phage LP-026]AHL18890.1 radical SAM domain-containing protein [Listeria phage LP-032]AHN84702.1 radical SAM domain-containing protein [Listeria phage LP-026]QDK04537.1 hypothetical protein FK481_0023 [Listeria phage LP-010]QDK04645.1 hypothetical protein FK482_0023 [Listeria phage LP-013]
MTSNYSILTNFGCHWTCPYCIVKNNDIGIAETNIQEVNKTIDKLIAENNLGFLSLSGGGDPMFHVDEERLNWYQALADKTHSVGAEYELHTSYKYSLLNKQPVDFDRIVYHCHRKEHVKQIKRVDNEIARAVFVVQEFMDEDYISDIVKLVEESDVVTELSFRQCIDDEYQTTYHLHDFLKQGHQKDWWYIEQDDYNNYIVNDKISHRYEDFKGENK